jgi:hypothetical protein
MSNLDRSIQAMTPGNVKTKMDEVVSKLKKLSSDQVKSMTCLTKSPPIAISQATSLLTSMTLLMKVFHQTATDLLAKRKIISVANKADRLKEGLLATKSVVGKMITGLMGQLPSMVKSVIPKNTIPKVSEVKSRMEKGITEFIEKFKSDEPLSMSAIPGI